MAIAIKSRSLSAAIFVPIDRWDRNKPNGEEAMTENSQPILIIGGTGKTGSRVARKLADLGMTTRVASRSGAIRFDWDDSST
jgi:phosphoglycerate dehydrogenase-like enzyme